MIDDEKLQPRLAPLSDTESVEIKYILVFWIDPFVRAGDFQAAQPVQAILSRVVDTESGKMVLLSTAGSIELVCSTVLLVSLARRSEEKGTYAGSH
jgi:hypothetical protein